MYVIIGGFRAVVLTDTVQGIIMLVGTVILLIATIAAGGGLEKIMLSLAAENPNLISPFGSERELTPLYVSSFWILVGCWGNRLATNCGESHVLQKFKIDAQSDYYRNISDWNDYVWNAFNWSIGSSVIPGIEIGDKVMPTLDIGNTTAYSSRIGIYQHQWLRLCQRYHRY